jgi:hypothetical protein
MPIVLSSATVSANAAVGTIVGALSLMDDAGTAVPANFTLDKDSGGYFAVDANNNIVTEWPAPLGSSGFFPVRVRASGITEALDSKAHFIISVVVPSPTTLAIRFIPNVGRNFIYGPSGRAYPVMGTTVDVPFTDAEAIHADQATRLMVIGTTADRPSNIPGRVNWPPREMYDTTLGAPIFLVAGSSPPRWVNITGSPV